MEKVTLSNREEFEKNKTELSEMELTNLSDVIRRKRLQDSLIDRGIVDFKEIKDINNISFGHFILIEKILTLKGIDLDKKVEILAPVILRPLEELKLDNENREKELEHTKKVLEEPLGNVMGAINRYLELRREYLFKTYNGVIYAMETDDDDENDESISIDSGQTAREFHNRKFFWNSMISAVAGGDIFKFNDAVELMMYVVMPFLAEKRSLEIVERLESKVRNS